MIVTQYIYLYGQFRIIFRPHFRFWFKQLKFEAGSRVDREALLQAGLIDKKDTLVKVLANGELSKSLTVAVDKVSEGARKKIEAAGGTVEVKA